MLYEVLSKLNILRLKYSSTSNCIRKSEEFFFPYYVLCTRCTGLRGFRHSIAVFFFFEMIEKIENTTYRSKTFSTLFLISKCRRAERKVNSACGCSKKKKKTNNFIRFAENSKATNLHLYLFFRVIRFPRLQWIAVQRQLFWFVWNTRFRPVKSPTQPCRFLLHVLYIYVIIFP